MAIYCEALSVIVKWETLHSKVVGGAETALRGFPAEWLWHDADLVRFGFMTPRDVDTWIKMLENWGLTFVREVESEYVSVDIVVIDQVSGPTCRCDWIECEIVDGNRWVWLAGLRPTTLILPVDPKVRNMKRILNEDAEGLPFSVGPHVDVSIDQVTGNTTYTARMFRETHFYDEHIRQARIAAGLGKGFDAYDEYHKAESYQALLPRDQLAAALACLWVFRYLGGPQIEEEVLRRWIAVTESLAWKTSAECWVKRAEVESLLGLQRAARKSLRKAQRLQRGNTTFAFGPNTESGSTF